LRRILGRTVVVSLHVFDGQLAALPRLPYILVDYIVSIDVSVWC
jgi:hypothetical protein